MSYNGNRESWKAAVDILSILSLLFLVIFCPLWMQHSPHTHDAQGHFVWIVKASFVVTPFCSLGLIWLSVRGARSTREQHYRPLRFVHWVISCLAMNYFVYLILTNLVWN